VAAFIAGARLNVTGGDIDVLVDGRYVQAQRSLDIAFRGSCNQRLIDMPGTLAAGEVRLWMPGGAANDE